MSEILHDTVGHRLLTELQEFMQNGGDFMKVRQTYDDLVVNRGLGWNAEVPRNVRLPVSSFLSHYEGEAMELHANCNTTVGFDGRGRLEFEGSNEDGDRTVAVLDVDRLLSALRDEG